MGPIGMARNLSGALKILDLDDFLAPSQECIIPGLGITQDGKVDVGGGVPMENPTDLATARGVIAVEGLPTTGWSQTRLIGGDEGAGKPAAVQITLSDCLACSGCVTSAETVLMTQQSSDQFLDTMAQLRAGTLGTPSASTPGTIGADTASPSPSPAPVPKVAVVSVSPQSRCARL